MTKQIAEAIVEICEPHLEISIYEDYSGRGMYGKTTTAIQVRSLADLVPIFCYVGLEVGQKEVVDEIFHYFVSHPIRTDDLGLDYVIY